MNETEKVPIVLSKDEIETGMVINTERLTEMSATELMAFVKECCRDNESVTKIVSRYPGCVLDWAKKVNEFVIFTVRAGEFDGKYVCNPNEYITVSFNTKTKKLFCLAHYLHNYSGYNIHIADKQNIIKQEIGYGFGSWEYNELNLDLTKKSSRTEHDYGCCCD